MTDFAKPTTPAEALRDQATQIEYTIRAYQSKIDQHQAVIAELREQWGRLLNDADRYEKYQPKKLIEEPTTVIMPDEPGRKGS